MTAGLYEYSPPGLWAATWKLLRLRILILLSGFRRAKLRRKISYVVLTLVLLIFLGVVFFVSWQILRFLRTPQLAQFTGDVTPFLESVPVLIVGGAFLGIMLTSFGVLLQALYLAGDMDFLLSTPLPIRAVFFSKLLQAILPNFGLICLFALPVLFGLGASEGYSFLYFPLVLVMLAALALAAAGISSLLVMLIVRLFPARRVAELLGFLGAIFSIVCSQSGNLARFENVSEQQATQVLNVVSRFNTPWSPLAWAGRGLVDIGAGRWATGIFFSALSLLLAGGVFALALVTAERLYYSGWANVQSRKQAKKAARQSRSLASRSRAAASLLSLAERRIPAAIRAILVKDFFVLRRDLRNMSQLVTPLIFGLIYAFMFLRGGGEISPGRGQAPALFNEAIKNLAVYGNVAISLFVSWMLVTRLAGIGFSQEGKSYWLLKSAPLSTAQLLTAKFLVAFLPSLALGWLFLLGISLMQTRSFAMLWFTLPAVALSIAGNCGLNLAFGVTGANFDWEDPRRMTRGSQGCFSAIAGLLYLPLSLGLFFGPPLIFALFSLPEALGQVIGLAVGGLFCLVVAVLPLWLVRQRVPVLGEA